VRQSGAVLSRGKQIGGDRRKKRMMMDGAASVTVVSNLKKLFNLLLNCG
jgi:hypothetical protein